MQQTPISGTPLGETTAQHVQRVKEAGYYDPLATDAALSGKTIAEGRPVVTVTSVPPPSTTTAAAATAPKPSEFPPLTTPTQQPTVGGTTTTTTTTTVKQGASVPPTAAAEQQPGAPFVKLAEEQLPGRRRIWLARLAQQDYKTTLQTWRERVGRFARSNAGWSWLPAALALLTALLLGTMLASWPRSSLREQLQAGAVSRLAASAGPSFEQLRCDAINRAGPLGKDLVELGPGSGGTLACLQDRLRANATCYLGIEPNRHFARQFEQRAHMMGLRFERPPLLKSVAEHLPLASNSIDTILAMHTLSYVNNAQAALHEVARVLEPGGKFIFLENVAERGLLSRLFQRLMGPWWSSLLGYRFQNTENLIRRVFEQEAGAKGRFKVDVDRFRATGLPLFRRFLAPHVRGVVTKLSAT